MSKTAVVLIFAVILCLGFAGCEINKNRSLSPSLSECSLKVLTPNGGERLTEASSSPIQWIGNDCDTLVRIELLLGSLRTSTIADSTPNDGEYTWIPEAQDGLVANYKMKITGLTSGAFDASDSAFSILPQNPDSTTSRLTVLSPNGGEAWEEGLSQSILWNSTGCDSTVRIDLLRDSKVVTTLAQQTDNDGLFLWVPHQDTGHEKGYAIRISDPTSGAHDASDSFFNIPSGGEDPGECRLTLTEPNGGEVWTADSLYAISWTSADCDPLVKIELLIVETDTLRMTIADSLPNEGSYVWPAAQLDGHEFGYRVIITDIASGEFDASDADFSIFTPTECGLLVSSPSGGVQWETGEERPITWISNHCDSLVTIALLNNGDFVATIVDTTENDGLYRWRVAQHDDLVENYQVRVSGLESEVSGVSSGSFEIHPPPSCELAIGSPNGGEIWTAGQIKPIAWDSSHCGSSVRIDLEYSGETVLTISASTANDGAYSWMVSQFQGNTQGYLISVKDLGSGFSDESDASFTIQPAPVCAVEVTSPNGGEAWAEGSTHAITWARSNCGAAVKLELLRNGSLASVINASTSNDGSYQWIVVQDDGQVSGYKIRVTDLENGTADESDVSFEIIDAPPPPDSFFCVSKTGTKVSGPSTTDIENFAWADEDCYHSIGAAMNEMSGGDQLWVDDGTYQVGSLQITADLSGSEGNYTIIRARNDGKVKLESSAYSLLDGRDGASYFEFRGFSIIDCGELSVYIHEACHHFKIIRTGWNQETGLITDDSHHGLMEECYAWGGPHRYPFQTSKGAHHIVFRRCLVRWDFSDTPEPQACFANYTCDEIHYQNCISLDGTDYRAQDVNYDGLKSFFTPNGSPSTTYTGCISLNMQGAGGYFFEGPAGKVALTDCIAWDHRSDEGDATEDYRPWPLVSAANYGGFTANRMTIGVSDIGDRPNHFDPVNHDSFRNSLVIRMQLDSGDYALSGGLDDQDYNCFYDNTGGRNYNGEMGPHCLTEIDPFSNGLVFLTGIQPGSFLKTAGENGSQIGAQIETRIGASGSLYGDPGWDQETGEPLWPFPYQDQIREDCRNFSMAAGEAYPGSPPMEGARGFCADGETLTSFIRNYIQGN